MPRAAFWQFAPVGLLPPLVFATQIDWLMVEIWGIWKLAVLFVLAMPLLHAAARRLQDTGMEGTAAYWPFMPFFILWSAYQLILWGGYLVGAVAGPWVIVIWVLALLVLGPLHIIALVASLFFTASILGQMLISSEPGTNRYGPNPHEVIP